MATLAFGHIHIAISSPWGIHMHYAMNNTTDNANFIDQVVYMCEAGVQQPSDSNPQS